MVKPEVATFPHLRGVIHFNCWIYPGRRDQPLRPGNVFYPDRVSEVAPTLDDLATELLRGNVYVVTG